MIRSPTRNTRSPHRISRLPGALGFRASCKSRFRFMVPQGPFRVGVSTWIWSAGMCILSGRRVRHSSSTVDTARWASRRQRKKKSPWFPFSSGDSPRFTRWALRMMADCSACRNTSRRNTVSIFLLRIRSENTFPAPTEGNWSASPTSTSRVPGRSARSSAENRDTSTMLISSTMTASASSGSFSVFWKVT